MIRIERSRLKPPHGWTEMEKQGLGATGEEERKLWSRARKKIQPALEKLFHGKCAYCESPVTGVARGEIDHFRPRHNAAGLDATEVDPDHYRWLGYAWENLYLSCADCNRRKRNLFPVIGRRAQPGATGARLAGEDALLIDPCADDPEEHLSFHADGQVRPLSDRGDVTLSIMGLNRPRLVKARAAVGNECERLAQSILKSPGLDRLLRPPRKAIDNLRSSCADGSPHAAVARAVWKSVADIVEKVVPVPAGDIKSSAAKPPPKKERTASRRRLIRRKAKLLEAVWVDEIEIVNFASIREGTLQFPGPEEASKETRASQPMPEEASREPWLMLIGRNGVGKSSILRAVALALTTPAKRRKHVPDASRCINRSAIAERKREKRRGRVTGHVRLGLTNGEQLTLYFQEGRKDFWVEGRRPAALHAVGYSSTRLPAGSGRKPPKRSGRVVMQNLFNPFVPLSDVNQWLGNTKALQSTPFRVLTEGLADLLSYPTDERVITRRGGRLYAHGTPVDELSDGYRSLAALATDLMRRLSGGGLSSKHFVGTVLLDEIETHLHPEWKLKVVDTLRRVFPMVRFIVATHDPLCLRGLGPGEVHRIYHDPERGRPVLRRLDVPVGLDADELLTGSWFGLSSTFDSDTRALFEKHRRLIRARQTQKVIAETREVRDELRRRLYGTPTETSVERMVMDLASKELDKEIHEFTPDDRKSLHEKLQKRLAMARRS